MHPVEETWLGTGPFCSLPMEQKKLLRAHAQTLDFARKQVLYAEDAAREYMWVIQAGFIQQTRRFGAEDQITVAVLGPGQIAGLLGFWTDSTFLLSARGLTSGRAIGVPMQLAFQLCRESPKFADIISRQAFARLAQAYESITEAGYDRVEQRILAVLLSIGAQYGSLAKNELRLDIPLTRQDIANLAHTTVETTIRTLRAWEKRGWMTTNERRIRLQQLDALKASILPAYD